MSSTARVAVIQFPGVNCEAESMRALERVGLQAEVFRWTRPAADLARFDAFLLPGGFSYQDRVRAGALAGKDPLVDALAEEAERGKPVLGICNGAQVLVEAGIVPGGSHGIALALARNHMPGRSGYYARWVYTRIERSTCVFTHALAAGRLLPLPVAHGEGRFTSREPERVASLSAAGQVPLRYARADGEIAESFPQNPNGDGGGWSVDYPRADINLMYRLSELTAAGVEAIGPVVSAGPVLGVALSFAAKCWE